AFGSIEHVTIECLRNIPRDRIQRSTQCFSLSQRIDLIVELLETESDTQFSNLSVLLLRAKELAKTRNLIAHNPLVLEVYEHTNGGFMFKETIASLLKKRQRISFHELETFANESERLASDLYDYSVKVFNALEKPDHK
ncbi:MAG: hypothetical protein WAW61_04995, partial [Methylococcaceae bacterium]